VSRPLKAAVTSQEESEKKGKVVIKYTEDFNPNVWLKTQAAELGIPAKKLLAMDVKRDPFNKGTETDWDMAEWFKKMYDRFGYPGIHLRRLHYRIANLGEGILLWDGETPYENERYHWGKISEAFIAARILGAVDSEDFVERRVKEQRVDSMSAGGMPPPSFEAEAPTFYGLPDAPLSTKPNLIGDTDLYLSRPGFEVSGYEYDPSLQPYVVEIWDEKSGDVDIFRSLAYRYGINYQPGVGYASITNIKRMLRRLADHEKPGRILYVSDFDKAGQNMPIQVARHSQFSCWELAEVAHEVAPEIMVDNAALTEEQVVRLNLPPIPGTTKREIDALEALHPGELERMLARRIEELQDPDLEQEIQAAREEAHGVVHDEINSIMEEHRERLQEIQQEAQVVVDRYRHYYRVLGEKMEERYRRLGERYERHIADLREEAEEQHAEIEEALESLEVDLPDLPEAEVEDADGWLYDSRRNFLDQTRRFRRAKGME
jgi:hypothetical protein